MRQLTDLLVIRISDSRNIRELQEKTLECSHRFPDLPGMARLHALGARPLVEPELVDGHSHRGDEFRAVYFRLPGTETQVLQVLGSATKANVGEADNAFVELLADVMDETRFESVWVADFGRLLRSLDYLSATWRTLHRRCDYLRHGGGVIDMASPTAGTQFVLEALSASNDARQIVRRTVNGKLRSYLNGAFPLAARNLAPGYTKTSDKQIALVDPAPTEAVSTIVESLGDPTLTNDQRAQRVAAVGGPNNPLAGRNLRATGSGEVIRRWFDHLDTWRTGIFTIDYLLPDLLQEVDLPVETIDTDEGRIWRLTYQLPLPLEGWASGDAFDAAIAARDRRREHLTSQGGTAAGRARKPFCGLPGWINGDHQYQLLSGNENRYELRRRPASEATERRTIQGQMRQVQRGWSRGQDGERVAVFAAGELHLRVAEGLAAAATEGMTVASATDALIGADDDVLEDLRQQLRKTQQRAANARRNANDADFDSQRRQFLNDAERAAAEQERLEADILRLARRNAGTEVAVDTDTVATALARVADQPDHVPAAVADALREVIHSFTVRPNGDGTATWTAGLCIPLAGGTLKLGPATGTIFIGHQRHVSAARNAALADRAQEAAAYILCEQLTVAEAAERLQIRTPRRVAQVVRDYLQKQGLAPAAAATLVADSPPQARRIVWERLHSRPYPSDISRPFAAHVAASYLDQPVTFDVHRTARRTRMSQTIHFLRNQGGWIPNDRAQELAQAGGISPITVDDWTNGRTRNGNYAPPIFTRQDDGLALTSCPHHDCDGWATEVRVLPEVPTLLLCPDCRRMPDPTTSSIVFPDDYFTDPTAA